jgi:DinB superfamily
MTVMEARAAALAEFDRALSRFERQLTAAPDDSLRYLKPGDDYAIGGLAHHVRAVLEHYLGVLDAIARSGFAPTEARDRPGLFEEANAMAKAGVTRAELAASLRDVERLHSAVEARLADIGDDDYERRVPVTYQAGDDPYPTSPADIVGWLSGHYEEHVPHIEQLLASWRASR